MMSIKTLSFVGLLVMLSGCHQRAADVSANESSQTATSTVSSASSAFETQRAEFIRGCVQSAVGPRMASQAHSEHYAGQVCDCVYDEGVKAYGSEAEWVSAMEKFDKKQQSKDKKLAEISEQSLNRCLNQYSPNAATASSASPAPQINIQEEHHESK